MPAIPAVCVCPQCRSPLDDAIAAWLCTGCRRTYPVVDGFVDFSPEIKRQGGLGQLGMEIPLLVSLYESRVRPNFVRSMGRNWDRALTPADEDTYLLDHVQPVAGPILDLACGAGRWTRTLADAFGDGRVIGFDLSYASLRASRAVIPNVLLLRGNALELPFADRSFGAINCSNSLQLIPNTPQVLQEVGRTLMPGGTFTCFTFRKSPPGGYRAFQATVERVLSVRAFSVDDLRSWLKAANMDLIDVSGPNLTLLFTARKAV
jgi:SAM-dependent methyltransferase